PQAKEGKMPEIDVFQGDSDRIIDNEYLGTLHFPPEASGQRVTFNLDEECLLHVSIEAWGGGEQPQELLLATRDTPEALKTAWQEENERRLKAAAEMDATSDRPKAGILASIRKVFGSE